MKISVYLKKCSATTSNICFRVREKNVDIKVVSPIAVHDKYWDTDTLCYRRTTAVTAIEQKRVPEQIAAIIERAEKTFSEKADGKWMKQVIGVCLTAFLQATILIAGLLVFKEHALLGIGLMLSSSEITRIAGAFGLDTSTRANIMSAVYTAQTAVHTGKAIVQAVSK